MQPRPLKGSSVLKLHLFADHLSQFSVSPRSQQNGRLGKQSNDLNYWQLFVDRFFSDKGVLRQQIWNADDSSAKVYEISTPALPRYYWTHYNSGVQNVQMILEKPQEKELPTGGHYVESAKSCFIYWFVNGCQLVTMGNLKAQFDQNGRIDILDLVTTEHNEYIPRARLQAAVESPDHKQSPSASKATGKRASQQRGKQQLQVPQEQAPQIVLPNSMVNAYGVTDAVSRFLELAESISQMQNLFLYSQQNPQLSPSDALNQLVASFQSGSQQQASFNMQQHPLNPALQPAPGQRTPGLNGPMASHFASPAAAHLNLPNNTASGSPATIHNMSPAMQNHSLIPNHNQMPGPPQAPTSVGMMAQPSHQGTNTSAGTASQGTSANTSPNVTNKRRRGNSVKVEGDDGGGPDLNGTVPKVKA
ncbi:MAG: hypothetical protein LQ347_005504, partial [Umbilicaria vellea]